MAISVPRYPLADLERFPNDGRWRMPSGMLEVEIPLAEVFANSGSSEEEGSATRV